MTTFIIKIKKLFIVVFRLLLTIGFQNEIIQSVMANEQLNLNGEWELYYGPQDNSAPATPEELRSSSFKKIRAIVPGNVEIDLMNAGILPDISKGTNVYLLRKYETYDWWYRKEIMFPKFAETSRLQLVFEGLDCIAEVWINDRIVGETNNMLIAWKFNVSGYLKPNAKNTIYVHIKSPILEARKYEIGMFDFAFSSNWESLHIRKAPHMYGWDIMPRIVSAGIWKEVYIKSLPSIRFRSVYWATKRVDINKGEAILSVHWDFTIDTGTLDQMKILCELRDERNKVVKEIEFAVLSTHGNADLFLEGVDFWWPRGYGKHPLYKATLQLKDGDGQILITSENAIGIRTVYLDRTNITTKDHPGRFQFVVNGLPVFVKGTNWVPLDGLHSRDVQHLDKMFEMLTDLNCNMVRCWGGNVYENTRFYEQCDKYGIMVWQDFSLACARYPQEKTFIDQIRKEAIAVIKKFRNHPSLVLWAGDNETDITYHWSGFDRYDPNENLISRNILRECVKNNDPFRDYLPSSPYVSAEVYAAGLDERKMPEVHLWGPRGYYKAPFYTNTTASFVSEIGYHGCPVRESIEQMMDAKFIEPDFKNRKWNDHWLAKSVMPYPKEVSDSYQHRNDFMVNQIEALFGECPDSLDDFIFASQVTQGEAKKFFIDFWRSNKPQKTGILWWNLRDGWPVISDAIVDYYFRKKLAYDYIKSVQHDIQVIVSELKEQKHDVVLVNDTRRVEHGKIVIRNIDTGKILFESDYKCPENGKAIVGHIPSVNQKEMWIIEWDIASGQQFKTHYLNGMPPFNLEQYKKWFELMRNNS